MRLARVGLAPLVLAVLGTPLAAEDEPPPSVMTVPLTIHTSETAGAVLSGRTMSAFIEVVPQCSSVECPRTPDTPGSGELPAVVWHTDPAPGQVFVIDVVEELGTLTLELPAAVPESAVIAFLVTMREAGTGRHLSTESVRFARDTTAPVITAFEVDEDGEGGLLINATAQDEASSLEFAELLVSRDGGSSFSGSPMDWQSGDFLGPTRFQTRLRRPASEELLLRVRAVDEAGNSAETPPRRVGPPLPDVSGVGSGAGPQPLAGPANAANALPPDPPGVSSPLAALPPLQITPRVYVDEKDVPGLPNADRKLELRVVLDNPGATPKTLVPCPMLHVHNPGDPNQIGQVLTITADGGQRVTGVYMHPRTFRFPFPLPTPFTIAANSQVLLNYSVKLSEFVPTLENFTRAEILAMIQAHQGAVSSTLYLDYFFNFNMEPGDVFQCPHGPNTWWKFGIDDPDDFTESFNWFDFTFFIDTTPPVIVPTVTPPPNPAGWNNTDVMVSWSVSDPESNIASSSGCGPTTLTAETPGTTLTCSATNRAGLSASVSVTVRIDKTGPVIVGLPAPGCTLWPPNHRLVQVAVVTALDGGAGVAPGSLAVTGVSSEPENGLGDGDTAPDVVVTGGTVSLRAERSGRGPGRTYSLTASASDAAGNATTATAACTVPHDRRRGP